MTTTGYAQGGCSLAGGSGLLRPAGQSGPAPADRPGLVSPPAGSGRPAGPGPARRGPARPGRVRAGWLAALLAGCDIAAVTIAALVTGTGIARGACYGLAVLLAMAAGGCYQSRIGSRLSEQAGRLVVATALPVFVLLPWTQPGLAMRLVGCSAALVLTLRAAAQAGLQAARRRGLLARPALVVGSDRRALDLLGQLRAHPELGLQPCGLLASQPDPAGAPGLAGAAGPAGQPVLGRPGDAGAVIDRFGIEQVLICPPGGPDHACGPDDACGPDHACGPDDACGSGDELAAVVRACRQRDVPVSVLPQLPEFGLAVPKASLDEIWATPLIPLRRGPGSRAAAAAKRTLDLALGSALAVVTAPVLLVLAAAVRADLRLPPLFRQERVVGRGRRATIAKLRTLRPAGDPDTTWVVPDGQCTRLGRVLRGTHADELPQLASVLRGDMSLVGPRPERPHFARKLGRDIGGYAGRERVRAGLTGWAQVNGLTGDTSIEDRARFDNFYIEYWSIWLDLIALARTVPSALRGVLAKGGNR